MSIYGNRGFQGYRWYLVCVATVILLASPAQAAGKLTPHTAEYRIKISVVSGRLNTELKTTDSGFIAKHVIVPTGLSKLIAHGAIAEESEFASATDGVYPIAYRSNDTISRDKTRADIRFDWDSNQASGTVNDEEILTVLEGLSHDRVSIQYELMHDLLNDGPSVQYKLFEVDELKTINVRSIGSKQIKVDAGTFDAIGIQHQAENSSRVTTLWCVKELDYLPVVIEQHRKGKLRVRATLRNYTPSTEPEGLTN